MLEETAKYTQHSTGQREMFQIDATSFDALVWMTGGYVSLTVASLGPRRIS